METGNSHENNGLQPPVLNPPPTVFGGYTSDGSPIPPSLPGPIFAHDVAAQSIEDANEAKRRRIARACDMCRKKKIKCDGKMPACTHCINYKTECVFTLVEKKRSPPKGAKYIEGLENRLARMESLLKLSGALTEEDNGRTDLGTLEKRLAGKTQNNGVGSSGASNRSDSLAQHSPSTSSRDTPGHDGSLSSPPTLSASTIASPETHKEGEEVVDLSDMMCSLVTNNCGETRYIGGL